MTFLAFFFQTAQQNPILSFVPVLLIFAIFYFLLFLPMQRQKKQTKQLLEGLKNGDDVITNGGLIGTIFAINTEDDTLVLRLKPKGTEVLVLRSAVSGLAPSKNNS